LIAEMNLQCHAGPHGKECVARVSGNRHDVGTTRALPSEVGRGRRAWQLIRLGAFGGGQDSRSETEIFEEIPAAGVVHFLRFSMFCQHRTFGETVGLGQGKLIWTCCVKLQYIYCRYRRTSQMSGEDYLSRIGKTIAIIQQTQETKIEQAAEAFARSIQAGGRAYLFGSGHSVIPVLDIFPRYGSFVGFYRIYDPRLMWFNGVGPGGARELLRLERHV
jgi:hypothetical protein